MVRGEVVGLFLFSAAWVVKNGGDKEVSERVSGRVLRFDVTPGRKGRDVRILAFWNVWAGETGFQHRVRPCLARARTKRKSGPGQMRIATGPYDPLLYNLGRVRSAVYSFVQNRAHSLPKLLLSPSHTVTHKWEDRKNVMYNVLLVTWRFIDVISW